MASTATTTTRRSPGVLSPIAGGAAAAAGTNRRPFPRSRTAVPVAVLTLATAAPVLLRGGFTDASRSLFVGLALIALAVVLVRDERPLARVARDPAVVVLLALAGLTMASALWTIGEPGASLRAGLVVGGLASLALVAAWVTRVRGLATVVGLIAALAVAESVIGLVSAGLRVEPFAQRIGGSWRPGGTFEYPPALALVQVSALPALGWAMLKARPPLRLFAAAAAGLSGATIALADSRVALALALALIAAATGAARRLGLSRSGVALAAATVVAAGAAAHLLIGGYSPAWQPGGDAPRIAAVAAIALASALVWLALRPLAARLERARAGGSSSRSPRALLTTGAIAAALVLAALGVPAIAPGSGPGSEGIEPVSGFDHGRAQQWGMAIAVGLERPLTGAGADAYVRAVAESETGPVTLYAHSLPLEAWAELGALGLALVIGLYAASVALLWRLRHDPRAWLVGPAVGAFLAVNLVDWPWHLAGVAAIWAVALGACLALAARRRAVI